MVTITSTLALALAALPVSLAATYNVQVGAGGNLVYDPEYVSAQPGDIINFTL
jgi:plastocyanin